MTELCVSAFTLAPPPEGTRMGTRNEGRLEMETKCHMIKRVCGCAQRSQYILKTSKQSSMLLHPILFCPFTASNLQVNSGRTGPAGGEVAGRGSEALPVALDDLAGAN
jgi:hypothetical protein